MATIKDSIILILGTLFFLTLFICFTIFAAGIISIGDDVYSSRKLEKAKNDLPAMPQESTYVIAADSFE